MAPSDSAQQSGIAGRASTLERGAWVARGVHGTHGSRSATARSRTLPDVELELVRCRLHDVDGCDVGVADLPAGWDLFPGDLLVTSDGRLVRVVDLVACPPTSPIAALVKVAPALELVR